jgi:ABC-type bacteriocin/lantibiotic exporter with double-glycine peptidase domain
LRRDEPANYFRKCRLPVSAVKGAELLRLEQVSYQYDRHGEKVLDDFSVTIHHGEMISIVGTDHCVILGKTVSPDTSANLSK